MRRLFFALWPDEQTRSSLARLNQEIQLDGIRKLRPSNLHATLIFMGNVDESMVAVFSKQAESIQTNSFTLTFDQLSFWPRPRVLCLTCQRQPKALYDLVNKLTKLVEQAGVKIDKRPFRAHVTMARKAKQAAQLDFKPLLWKVGEFALVESLSTDNGVVYKVLESW